jgi:DNA polymerase (family 10)
VLPEKSFGAALQYFTGNVDHNVRLRQLAISKGWKLSEYGIFDKKGRQIAGRSEEEVYRKLGLQFVPPELRENQGEVDAALKHKLPNLIGYDALKGDLHVHTKWSDGNASTEAMVRAAQQLGYSYIAITDHSKSQRIARGLSEKKMRQHIDEIRKLQKKFPKIRLLIGSEVDILPDGKLDYPDSLLKEMDVVVGSVHSRFKSTKEEMTRRILKAMDSPYLKVLGHPTGRLISRREPYQVELADVFEKAAEQGIALEINSSPDRLDLRDTHILQAKGIGCTFAVSTDAHAVEHLENASYGIAQARRGWLTASDVINAQPLAKVEKWLKR